MQKNKNDVKKAYRKPLVETLGLVPRLTEEGSGSNLDGLNGEICDTCLTI